MNSKLDAFKWSYGKGLHVATNYLTVLLVRVVEAEGATASFSFLPSLSF